jgi:hypothetical protein
LRTEVCPACCGGASLRETSGTETTDELLTAAE